MNQKDDTGLKDWAHFRFSVIGGLLARPPDKGRLKEQLEKLAAKRWRHPITGQWTYFGVSTIERWYYRALNSDDPVGALGRKLRSDVGTSTVMTGLLIDKLAEQYALFPHFSYQLHADNLAALIAEQPQLGKAPSYATVCRAMKARGWYRRKPAHANQTVGRQTANRRLDQREVRGFEASHCNSLWHLDFHQAHRRVVDSAGRWHTPVALCVLDDFSRLCCHIQWYLNETAENLFHGLKQAFLKRGLPRALMTDNGAAMTAHETENGLKNLSIQHDLTLPYSAYQNGKQENFWAQLEGRLMKMVTHVDPLTLDFLNRATLAWAEMEYNRSVHRETRSTPLNRLLEGPDVGRPCCDYETLQFFFTVQQRRTQRRTDGTIQISGVRFEVPSRFGHLQHLWVRYQSWDLSQAFLVDRNTGNLLARIYPQDKQKNANGLRKPRKVPAALPENTPIADPIPPLLRKILSDYAESGLPPAYLPKKNESDNDDER
jgi:transposase InsO family protein